MVATPDVLSLIPQRPPFVMVDELVSYNETGCNTKFLVKATNLLVSDGELSEAGLTENIAQTAAAGLGCIKLQTNGPILIGYIAAIKNLEVFAQPKVGDVIETNVTITNQVFDVTIIDGTIKCERELLAKCEMKIFIKQ